MLPFSMLIAILWSLLIAACPDDRQKIASPPLAFGASFVTMLEDPGRIVWAVILLVLVYQMWKQRLFYALPFAASETALLAITLIGFPPYTAAFSLALAEIVRRAALKKRVARVDLVPLFLVSMVLSLLLNLLAMHGRYAYLSTTVG